MANAVTSAIGTQRQFAKQPERVYKANLKTPSFSRGISTSADEDAKLLARSLGVLGGAIMKESVASDNRKEQYAQIAHTLINARTAEDREALSSVELLKYGDFDLSDNPYAVAIAEEAKGKAIASSIKADFTNSNLASFKNSEEAVKAFSDKLNAARTDAIDKSKNTFAFDKGIYEGHIKDTMAIADKQRKDASEEQRQIAYASAEVQAGDIVSNSLTMSTPDLVENFTALVNTIRIQGNTWSTKQKVAFFNDKLERIAKTCGSQEKLDALSNIVIGTDREGNNYTLGKLVDIPSFYAIAAVRAEDLRTTSYKDFMTEAEGCSSEAELDQFYQDAATKYDRVTFEAGLNKRNQLTKLINERQADIQTERNAMVFAEAANKETFSNYSNQVAAFMDGKTKDVDGNYVGIIHKVSYNEKGVKKLTKADKNDLVPHIEYTMATILNDNELSPQEKNVKLCKFLSFDPLNFYAKDYAETAASQLANLDVSTLDRDKDGNYVLPAQVTQLLRMRNDAGHYAEEAFGSEAIGKVDALNSLMKLRGNWNDGIKLYSEGMPNFEDKELQAALKAEAKTQEFSLRITDLEGSTVIMSDVDSEIAQARAKSHYTILRSCGVDEKQSLKLVEKAFVENNIYYNNTLIPRSVFKGFSNELCKQTLDEIKTTYANSENLTPALVKVQWNNASNSLTFSSMVNEADVVRLNSVALRDAFYKAHDKARKEAPAPDNIDAVGKTGNDFSMIMSPKERQKDMTERGMD